MKKKDRLKFKKMGFTDKQINNYRSIDYSKLTNVQRKAIDKYIRRENSLISVFVFIILFLPGICVIGYNLMFSLANNNGDFAAFLIIFIGMIGLALFVINYLLNDEINYKKRTDRLKKISQDMVTYENYDGVEGLISGRDFDLLDENGDGKIMIHEFYPLTEQEVVDRILKVDENFSLTEFKMYVKNVFIIIQEAFVTKNYRLIRAFESDVLFNQHKLYINKLIDYDDLKENIGINIKGVLLKDYKIEAGKQIVVVALTTGKKRNLGNRFSTCNGDVPYILTFMRDKGVKTLENKKLSTTNCRNCGAIMKVDSHGFCKYCNTSLVSGELDWVLVDIKNISLGKIQ